MIPVGERQYSFFIVLILVRGVRVMDDQRSTEPIRILACIMSMIPVSPWLLDLRMVNWKRILLKFGLKTHLEIIRERAPRRNRTLRDTDRSVHVGSSILI